VPLAFAPLLGFGLIVAAGGSVVSGESPFGWLGSVLLAALGAFTLHRAGSVKAWKETAEARAERLEDLERQVGELRSELGIPERIEGIIGIMATTAKHQEETATARLRGALDRLDDRWNLHDRNAEARTARLESAIAALQSRDADRRAGSSKVG
jgi:hypothetical protein